MMRWKFNLISARCLPGKRRAAILATAGRNRQYQQYRRFLQSRNPDKTMLAAKTLALFLLTALAEIVGCYLPYLWLKKGASAWLLAPAALSLALFAWLLTLHPNAAGRVYAAYGGVYITVALAWLWAVDGIRPSAWDVAGVLVSLAGMGIIMFAPRS